MATTRLTECFKEHEALGSLVSVCRLRRLVQSVERFVSGKLFDAVDFDFFFRC